MKQDTLIVTSAIVQYAMPVDAFNPAKSLSGPGDPLLRWDTLMYVGREMTFETLPERGSRTYKHDFIQESIDAGYIRDAHSHFELTDAGRDQLQGAILAVVKAHPMDDDLVAEQLTRCTDMNTVSTEGTPSVAVGRSEAQKILSLLTEAEDD